MDVFSNKKYLFIIVICDENNECYSECFTKEELGGIYKYFSKFASVGDIHKSIMNYLEWTLYTNITINKINGNLLLQFKNFGNSNKDEISFILSSSFTYNTIIPTRYNEMAFQEIVTSNKHDKTSIWILLNMYIYITISITLLISLFILCLKCQFNIDKLINPSLISNILTLKDVKMISDWINPETSFKYTLLYQGSRDGDSAKTFHDLCDNKGPTVSIIQTQQNWIFGGYTKQSWSSNPKSSIWEYQTSKEAFLFSLNNTQKYSIVNSNYAIFCQKTKGPTFGHGFDLEISDNCFRSKSYCKFPSNYGKNEQENEFNGGESNFIVKEIEVYLVEYNKRKKLFSFK